MPARPRRQQRGVRSAGAGAARPYCPTVLMSELLQPSPDGFLRNTLQHPARLRVGGRAEARLQLGQAGADKAELRRGRPGARRRCRLAERRAGVGDAEPLPLVRGRVELRQDLPPVAIRRCALAVAYSVRNVVAGSTRAA